MTCPVCGEPVPSGEPFFDTLDGIAHERCVMRGRRIEHEETTRIVVDVSRPLCPACTDGIDRDGERCARCGGTADHTAPFRSRPTLREFARDVFDVELPPHAEALLEAVRDGRRLVVHVPPRHGRALALRIVRAFVENLEGSDDRATTDE